MSRTRLVWVEPCGRAGCAGCSYGTHRRVLATATILFPVGPAIIQRLLTDYAHWPELFDVRMRMAEIREQDGKVFTDIRIDHALLPGERRLLSETRTLPTGGLLTELKGGDFKQYRRFWKLIPVDGGTHTKAEFELFVEIDTNMPDWMVAAGDEARSGIAFSNHKGKGARAAGEAVGTITIMRDRRSPARRLRNISRRRRESERQTRWKPFRHVVHSRMSRVSRAHGL